MTSCISSNLHATGHSHGIAFSVLIGSDTDPELSCSNHQPITRGPGELLEGFNSPFHSVNIIVVNVGESSNTHDDATKKLGQLKSLLGEIILFFSTVGWEYTIYTHTYVFPDRCTAVLLRKKNNLELNDT